METEDRGEQKLLADGEVREQVRQVIREERSAETAESTEARVAAPMADPGPAALGAFGITLGLLSIVNAGFVDAASTGAFIPLGFFAGGFVILLAGLISFRSNEIFTANVFTAYGIFWIAIAFFFMFQQQIGVTDEALGPAVGLTLFMWTILTVYVCIASLKTNWTIFITFLVLVGVFATLSAGFWTGSAGLIQLGGYLGILDAALAFYLSAASLINPMFGRDVLPVK